MACLDTNFIIDLIKGKKEVLKAEKELKASEEELIITSPTIVELIRGLHLESTLKNIAEYEADKIDELLSSLEILSLEKESAILAGKIHAELINKGEDIGITDIMIAAIAIQNNETLITRNKKHFEKIPNLKIETY